MKTTVFILSIGVALFVLGCQDNSSLNPAAGQEQAVSATTLGKPAPLYYLPLKGLMQDPMSANGMTEISGQIDVAIEGEALLEVKLYTEAALIPFVHVSDQAPWKVSGKSADWVKVLPGRCIFIKKSYKVAGRNDGAILHVAVKISRLDSGFSRSVELEKMCLEIPRRFVTPQDAGG